MAEEFFTKLVGVTYGDRQKVLAEMSKYEAIAGAELTAIPATTQEHGDEVRCFWNGVDVGFLRASAKSGEDATPLKRVWNKQFKVIVTAITGGKGMYNHGCNVKVIVE